VQGVKRVRWAAAGMARLIAVALSMLMAARGYVVIIERINAFPPRSLK